MVHVLCLSCKGPDIFCRHILAIFEALHNYPNLYVFHKENKEIFPPPTLPTYPFVLTYYRYICTDMSGYKQKRVAT